MIWLGLVGFYGILTFVDYLFSNTFYTDITFDFRTYFEDKIFKQA